MPAVEGYRGNTSWGHGSSVKHLPTSMCKALGSIPSTRKEKRREERGREKGNVNIACAVQDPNNLMGCV
jgi:hypothetical protein